MKTIYKQNLPTWCNNLNKDYKLLLSDDLDSLLSTLVLQKLFGCEVNSFYSFSKLYKTTNPLIQEGEVVGVDLALTGDAKTFDNHVVRLGDHFRTNPNSINCNTIFNVYAGGSQYHKKYAGSTLLTILSLYNVDLSRLSDEAKKILLCIDSAFLGFYSPYKADRDACKFFLTEVLELDILYETLGGTTKEEFREIQERYNLGAKININEDGALETDCNLFLLSLGLGFDIFDWIELPKYKFKLRKSFKNAWSTILVIKNLIASGAKVFSMACTSKFYVSFSIEE
jgi:hypothetical protein